MTAAWVSLIASAVAVGVWVGFLIRVIEAIITKQEARWTVLAMPVVGMVATVGTLASAIGLAMGLGIITVQLNRDAITFISNMGRGALLMGGMFALVTYQPRAMHR